ncbi:hypothetical protein CTEN210_13518 [Chaetoceros tenuissimus]|uniref:Uncharacterized protein n=1 Tax=Chaetoceros tenuissimus TaxID=426638 RepID=A0AAD3D383_9STRA|nr:hypothetical protein CTEN210_13518 [Chaetoceros tenuissimus]
MEYIPLKNFSVPQITNTHRSHPQDISKNTWIHTDPRICRGSVYAKPVITEDQERARLRLERDQRSRRRVLEARVYNRQLKRERTRSPVKGRKHFATQTESTIDEIMQHYEKENDGCCDDFRMLNEDECTTEINVCPIDYDDSESNEVMDTEILGNVKDNSMCRNESIVQEYSESIWNDARSTAMEHIMNREEVHARSTAMEHITNREEVLSF